MQSAEGIAGGAHLVGGSRGLQQHLFVQRTKGVQALEMLRTIEQRTCVVFCLEVSVSHCGHCSDGGEVGETLPPGSAIGSTRKRVRGCHPSSLVRFVDSEGIVVEPRAPLQAPRPGVITPDRLRAGTTFWGARACANARIMLPRTKVSGEAAMAAAPQSTADSFIIETRHLTKEFSGFVAVSNVDLRVRRGQIHALIGPNGAGKTTFFNLLTKFQIPTRGQILYRGEDITLEKPAQVARRGIVRSFQMSAVFPHLTVLENVRIGLQRSLATTFHFWKRESRLEVLNARAVALLDVVDLGAFARVLAVELPYGRKRALEIATTLAMDPELMLLDEPTQGMGHEDVDRVTTLIKQASAKRTILMVEHNMQVVAKIADTITVLQRGQIIASGTYAEVSRNPLVIEAYMGSTDAELRMPH